jgi:hypothetical protein
MAFDLAGACAWRLKAICEEEGPMSRVPWHLFKDRQPRAHLLVAAIEADRSVGPDLQEAQSVLQRFVRRQKPSIDYATTVVREAGRPEIYLAFDDEDDARKVAAAVKAEATVS